MGKIKIIFIFIINFIKFLFMSSITQFDRDGLVFRGCRRSEIKEAEAAYKKLAGRGFSSIHKVLLYFFSQRFLFITLSENSHKREIIGLDFYYINYRDFKDKTIHEGYIGVLPSFEGKGIASQMRRMAKEHFKRSGFKGISSRISIDNVASLRSAEKVGFKPVEEYFDNDKKEKRYYLICNFINN